MVAGSPSRRTSRQRLDRCCTEAGSASKGRLYAATGIHFRFDPQTGAYLGTRKVDRTIELSQDGQSFSAIARATTYDANGNVLGVGAATSTGTRIPIDRIPN